MEDKVEKLPNIKELNELSLPQFSKVVNTLFETTEALSNQLVVCEDTLWFVRHAHQ